MKAVGHERIELEMLSSKHFEHYLSLFSPAVRDALHVRSLDEERVYIEQLAQEHETFFFGIMQGKPGKLIGAIAIRDACRYAGQLYCWVHEDYWGTGYFQQAIALAAHHYFDQTDHRYFTARVDVKNMRSYRALKKCGFADIALVRGPYGLQFELVLRRNN